MSINELLRSPYNPERPFCDYIQFHLASQPPVEITGYAAEAVFRAIEIQLTQGPDAIAQAIKKALEDFSRI